ncbi:MAG: cation diffusion facilitator family transporter [Candidatus Lokiarchaeota archaeon]|nr:cation diffusion facilitator family transporter [Candidatus Lokiarchaeota archaeon]
MNIKIKFGIIAFFVILIQSAIKLVGVLMTGSLSFLSETVDTLTDIFFVILTVYSIYLSQKPPDYEHMYGHRKIDSIGGLIQGIILINLYVIIIFTAILSLIEETYGFMNPGIGLQLLIISFIINITFSRILIWEGKKHNSLSLRISGLNLFQDSLRALLIIINFIIALLFSIEYFDPIFSLILAIWIIFMAIKLSKEGIKDLLDVNPISALILEEIKLKIFNLEHVNAVKDLKVRVSGEMLFVEVHVSVEDHIPLIHANEITKSINNLTRKYFPSYKVETIIEMNPLGGEASIGEKIINLLYSMRAEFEEIVDFQDLNVFRIEEKYFISVSIIVNEDISLEEAHDVSSEFERQLKTQEPLIIRIITHIESEAFVKKIRVENVICTPIEVDKKLEIQKSLENLLRSTKEVRGYHGLEFWTTSDFCILELHIFFDGVLNISKVHKIVSFLEQDISEILKQENVSEIILHSEPVEGRTDGILF